MDESLLATPKNQSQSIINRILSGSFWTIFGYGSQQILRLSSNLILSRLLFPEAFGLMTLVNVVIMGLEMMADFGIGPNVVQSKRGDDPVFLNTAWTFQVIRGIALWLVICLLAWPASKIYNEPLLLMLLPATGFNSIISGFRSTKWLTAERHITIGKRTILELLTKFFSTITTIGIAYYFPTVWALIIGTIVGSFLQTVFSHLLLEGDRNKFFLEKDCVHEIFHFGIWILLATFATYLSGQGLRLIQGSLIDSATLGIISIAGMIAWSLGELLSHMTSKVLFPLYAKYNLTKSNEIKFHISRTRLYFAFFSFPFYIIFIFWGQHLINFLYDSRYEQAGLFVSIITISTALVSITLPYGSALIAFGHTKKHLTIQVISAILRVSGVFIGYKAGGVVGMLMGNWVAALMLYPLQIYFIKSFKLWQPKFDIIYFTLILVLVLFRFL